MERFQINYEGTLTGYYNDDKKVTEITIPDRVKYIYFNVFDKYQNIRTVILPDSFPVINNYTFNNMPVGSSVRTSVHTIKYRGIAFSMSSNVRTVFEMIRDKDYSKVLDHDLKYPVVMQIFFNEGDDVTTAYIKKNFKKFFIFLTDMVILQNKLSFTYDVYNSLEYLKKLIKSGKFILKRNIDTYIKLADEMECYEVFDMLNEYREENNF